MIMRSAGVSCCKEEKKKSLHLVRKMFKLINQTFPKSKLVIYANTSMNKIMIYLKYLTNSLKYTKTIISLDNFKLIKLST